MVKEFINKINSLSPYIKGISKYYKKLNIKDYPAEDLNNNYYSFYYAKSFKRFLYHGNIWNIDLHYKDEFYEIIIMKYDESLKEDYIRGINILSKSFKINVINDTDIAMIKETKETIKRKTQKELEMFGYYVVYSWEPVYNGDPIVRILDKFKIDMTPYSTRAFEEKGHNIEPVNNNAGGTNA